MNHLSHKQFRIIISSILFLFFFLFIVGVLPTRYLEKMENQLYDFRLRSDLLNTVDDRIVILDIDEKSISALGQWPWSRTLMAELVDKLNTDYQIKVIGFDSVFPEAEDTSAKELLSILSNNELFQKQDVSEFLKIKGDELDGDSRFAESLVARNVVVGYTFEDYRGDDADYLTKGFLSEPLVTASSLESIDIDFYRAGGFVGNYEYMSQATIYGGFFNYPRESSSLRKVPLLYEYNGDAYPSLALRTAMVSLGVENIEFLFENNAEKLNSLTLEYLKLADKKIPVDGRFAVYVPYRGGIYSFPYVSIIDVLNGDTPLEMLRDKILLMGTSATGMMDLRSTPVGDTYIGVEIHASIISGILDERFKLKPSYMNSIEAIFLLLITITLHLSYSRLGAIGVVIIFPVTVASVLGFGFLLWHEFNFVIPLANSMLLVFTQSFIHTAYDFFVESRQKRRMNQFFEQYIPSELVKEMDSSTQELSLSGDNKEMSVLFSDVRGFTTISETMTPGDLTQLMNEFLTPITKVVHDNRGTIDKYMGDCVMAFWGAPLTDEQHANNAVRASFKLINAIKKIQPEFDKKNWPKINVGVGISSGEMYVGNMGSEFRMAYTVMGNNVNIGARLEGLTKTYGVDIIVSDITASLATAFVYRELDRVLVKGKNNPIIIFEPLGKKDELSNTEQKELACYNDAIVEYHQQNWEVAKKSFEQLKSTSTKTIYDIYLSRIANYQHTPPKEGWNGVFEHTTK